MSGTGSISSGTNTLTTTAVISGISNGMTIYVSGAGPRSTTLNATVTSGGGTVNLVLSANASTTVTSASVTTAGATVYTVGSITTGTAILNVASTTGWVTGEGMDVTGAGAGGADLITTVSAVTSATVLTLAANAATTVTNAKINHDDTAAINAALTTTQNVQLPPGQFNVTGTLNIAYPQWVQCAGAGVGTIPGFASPTPLGGTIIWNRGKTNNVIHSAPSKRILWTAASCKPQTSFRLLAIASKRVPATPVFCSTPDGSSGTSATTNISCSMSMKASVFGIFLTTNFLADSLPIIRWWFTKTIGRRETMRS